MNTKLIAHIKNQKSTGCTHVEDEGSFLAGTLPESFRMSGGRGSFHAYAKCYRVCGYPMKRMESAMNWIDANSSSIKRFAYDPASQILKVEFQNGGKYDYFDVPEVVFESMCSAPSKGQFFVSEIKGTYSYARA